MFFKNFKVWETEFAGRKLSVETGKMAGLANASVMVRYGDTNVLCTVTASAKPREGVDFFPLSVDYEEKMYSVGRIPGSFQRREGRASEKAILTSRCIDRPIRPLFPKDLRNDCSVVATVMSNGGLFRALEKAGMKYETTSVGDRFVFECMEQNGYRLGGEQSGHIILRKYATTGDGLLTAIMLAEEIRDRKLPLSKLAEDVVPLPQKTKNVRVIDKASALNDPAVAEEYAKINTELGKNGRALLRASGTEPVVRIMLECETEEACDRYIARMYNVIKKKGHCRE